MSKAILIQRCANGVICIPTSLTNGGGGDLSQAFAFSDVMSTSGDAAKFLQFVTSQLAPAVPTPAPVAPGIPPDVATEARDALTSAQADLLSEGGPTEEPAA